MSDEKKTKKERKKRDPTMPKNALTGYMLYSTQQRNAVRAAHPKLNFGDIGKLLGSQWNALSEREKAFYTSYAKIGEARHYIAMANWKATQNASIVPPEEDTTTTTATDDGEEV